MTIPTKLTLTVFTLGTLSAIGATTTIYSQNNSSLQELINKEYKYILLDTEGEKDNAAWEKNWESYKTTNSKKESNKDDFKLNGWVKAGGTKLIDLLKTKCKELASKKINNKQDELYKNVTNYCGRYISIKDQMRKDGLLAKDTKGDDSVWSDILLKKDNLKNDFTNLEIKPTSSSNVTAKEIKDACEKALEKDKSKEDYEKSYESYKKVCIQSEKRQ